MKQHSVPASMPSTPLSQLLKLGRIPGLDVLRAIAVLLVLINHSESFWAGPILLANGGLGVEIFFVLSGFLITSMLLDELHQTRTVRLGAFFQRRAARLLPVFYLYLLVGLAYLAAKHKPIPWGAVASSSVYVLNYFQAFTGAPTHFLSHCWSLAVEEQFYLLWPIALAYFCRHQWKLPHTIMVLILMVWVYRATLQLTGTAPDEYLYRALDTRADHLLIGCLLATLLRKPSWQARIDRLGRSAMVRPALVLLLIGSGSLHASTDYKYVIGYALEPMLIATLIPLTILTAGAHPPTLWSRLLNARLLILTGQASYGVYLFHQLIMHPARTAAEHLTHQPLISIALSIAFVIMVAHLSFTYLENPLRQRLRPKAPEGKVANSG